MFGVNMTFIPSSEVKNVYFMSANARMKYTFFHFTR